MLTLIIILSLALVVIFILGMFFDPEFGMGPELLFSSLIFCVGLISVICFSFGYSSDNLIQKIYTTCSPKLEIQFRKIIATF